MITIQDLSRYYGNFHALKSISFEIGKGEIVGFLGPNGAGKTTTMRIMTGALSPCSGDIFFRGDSLQEKRLAFDQQLGYLPESAPSYPEMTVQNFLKFVARIRDLKTRNAVESVMDLCALTTVSRKQIGALSKGYRQRVGLAQALIHDPEILILDEPSSGLDPNQIQEMMELIKGFAGSKTVLFSSHILAEVESVATRVVILNDGEIVADDNIDRLKDDLNERVMLRVGGAEHTVLLNSLNKLNGVNAVATPGTPQTESASVIVTLNSPSVESSDLARHIISNGWQLIELSEQKSGLSELFERLTGHDS